MAPMSSWIGAKLRPDSREQKNGGGSAANYRPASPQSLVEIATPDENCPNDLAAFTSVAQMMALNNNSKIILLLISQRMFLARFNIYLKSLQLVDFLLHTHRAGAHRTNPKGRGHNQSFFSTNSWIRENFLENAIVQQFFDSPEQNETVQRQVFGLVSLIQDTNLLDSENNDPKKTWMIRVLKIPMPEQLNVSEPIRLAPSPAYYPNTTMEPQTMRNPIQRDPSPAYNPDGSQLYEYQHRSSPNSASPTYNPHGFQVYGHWSSPNSAGYQQTQEPIRLAPSPAYHPPPTTTSAHDTQNPIKLNPSPTWYPNHSATVPGAMMSTQVDNTYISVAPQNTGELPRNETSLPFDSRANMDRYGSQTPGRANPSPMYYQHPPPDTTQPLSKETVSNRPVDQHGSFSTRPIMHTQQGVLDTFMPSVETQPAAKPARVSGYETSSWQQWKSLPKSQLEADHLSPGHIAAQRAAEESRPIPEDTTCWYRARAICSYSNKPKGHLELFQGKFITVTEMSSPHWWVGSNHKGEEGMFPRNFVEILKGGEEAVAIDDDALTEESAPPKPMGGSRKSPQGDHTHASTSRSPEQSAPLGSSHVSIREANVQAPTERIEDSRNTLPSLHSIEEMTHRLEHDELHPHDGRPNSLPPQQQSQPGPQAAPQAMSQTTSSLVSKGSRLSSDLVRDSKLETVLSNSGAVVRHISYDSNPRMRRQRARKEETWRRCKELGTGAFGRVWLQERLDGSEAEVGMLRAVKEIAKSRPQNIGKEIDYDRELEAIAKFSHSKYVHCFVKSFGWYESDAMIYITMEYMAKGDLQSHLTQPFPEDEVKDITFQLLEGLSFMHKNGFAHRDLKPANILVSEPSPNWWVKIGDFGISKRAQEESTVFRTVVGTQGYLAPEVIGIFSLDDMSQQDAHQGSSNSYTISVDLWALGAIMFKLLTNKDVFDDPRKLARYVTAKQPFPSELVSGSGASEACVRFLEQVMGRSPSERPSSSQALGHRWLSEFQNPPEEPLENLLESLSVTPAAGPESQSGFSTINTMASAQWPSEYR